MITPEQAKRRLCDLSTDQVRDLTVLRIRGEDTAPVGDQRIDEPSEDLVIQLLRNDVLPKETRRAVISGCELVYSKLLAWLAAPDHSNGGETIAETATRLCRVVDVAEPNELRGHADAMLNLALSAADLPSGVLPATVRAGMAHGCTPDHIPVWEQVLKREEVAAYAFNALLAIDPLADRIARSLAYLWQKELCEKWNVDTEFLARKAARLSASESVILHALFALDRELAAQPYGEDVKARLRVSLARRSWSQGWESYLPQKKMARDSEIRVMSPSSLTFDFSLQDYCLMLQGSFWAEEEFVTEHSRVSEALVEQPASGQRVRSLRKRTTPKRSFDFAPDISRQEKIRDFSEAWSTNKTPASLGIGSWKEVQKRVEELAGTKGNSMVFSVKDSFDSIYLLRESVQTEKGTEIACLRHPCKGSDVADNSDGLGFFLP